ncbi:MAG: hypothetical protein MMC23_006249 [Stictis urceolatum]|nr:hypothetical protein [Stictis urceolata]
MASSSSTTASPFTRAVVSSMRKLYPEALADKSFDNTGLLLEAPSTPSQHQSNLALLTIDLTRAVCTEAIEKKASCVIAYHPIIFRGLKALTLGDSQQESLLRLAFAGISVYSPHTAVDAAPGGLSDWLADIVSGASNTSETSSSKPNQSPKQASKPQGQDKKQPKLPNRPSMARQYSKPTYPAPSTQRSSSPSTEHTRSTIIPSPNPPPDTPKGAGMGRLVTFSSAQSLPTLIERIARGVGTPAGFHVAVPQGAAVEKLQIRTVAVCAGSGGSVLSQGEAGRADLWLTGELGHHEALAATERGGCVVSLGHSNTERGYLPAVMKGRLEGVLKGEMEEVRKGWEEEGWEEVLGDEGCEVVVSEMDRDPFGIVLLQGSEVEGTRLEDGSVVEGSISEGSGNGRRPG